MATDDTTVSRPFRLNFSDLPRPPRRTQTVTAPLPRAVPPAKPVVVAAAAPVKKKRAPRKAAAAVTVPESEVGSAAGGLPDTIPQSALE